MAPHHEAGKIYYGMRKIRHPAELLDPATADELRNTGAEAEKLKHLHPDQLKIIYEQNWFKIFVPKYSDGAQLSLPAALELEEALAWIDGSLGWTVTLCAGAGWFIGFIDPAMAAEIFSDEKMCLGGSGNASGIATISDDGFVVNGQWDYATGANAATIFTANCQVEKNGQLLKEDDGSPLIQSFLFKRSEVTIHNNWQRIGMIATASQRFAVNDLHINNNRSFIIKPEAAVLKDPVYQYPFLQLAETTLAVNSSGMALRFAELAKPFIYKTGNTALLNSFDCAEKELEEARQIFYRAVNESWQQCVNENFVEKSLLNKVTETSKILASTARKFVDQWYPHCGMFAADPATEINRVWRNLHTASQHRLLLL